MEYLALRERVCRDYEKSKSVGVFRNISETTWVGDRNIRKTKVFMRLFEIEGSTIIRFFTISNEIVSGLFSRTLRSRWNINQSFLCKWKNKSKLLNCLFLHARKLITTGESFWMFVNIRCGYPFIMVPFSRSPGNNTPNSITFLQLKKYRLWSAYDW